VFDGEFPDADRMLNEEGAGQDEHNLRGTCFRAAKGGLEVIRRVFEPQRLDLELQRIALRSAALN
jgi:hypothetical protein